MTAREEIEFKAFVLAFAVKDDQIIVTFIPIFKAKHVTAEMLQALLAKVTVEDFSIGFSLYDIFNLRHLVL